MLDLRAAGEDRRLDRLGAVRVDERPQAERVRFAAGRLQLFVAHRLLAAVADAGGGEDLDEVRARPSWRRGWPGGVDPASPARSDSPRPPVRSLICRTDVRMRGPGRLSFSSARADLEVPGLADALDRREPVHDRDARVLDRRLEPIVGRLAGVVEAAVLAEVPADMDVRVDEAGQERVLRRDRG